VCVRARGILTHHETASLLHLAEDVEQLLLANGKLPRRLGLLEPNFGIVIKTLEGRPRPLDLHQLIEAATRPHQPLVTVTVPLWG